MGSAQGIGSRQRLHGIVAEQSLTVLKEKLTVVEAVKKALLQKLPMFLQSEATEVEPKQAKGQDVQDAEFIVKKRSSQGR